MEKLKLLFYFAIITVIPLFFSSCSSSDDVEKTPTTKKDTVIIRVDTVRIIEKVEVTKHTFTIQIGAFSKKDYVDLFVTKAEDTLKTKVEIEITPSGLYKITVGKFDERADAEVYLQRVKTSGYPDAFIKVIK
ncbi:MAG: SPOR domain-containing protein [Ignavibacteria bacterium]|nr:SPOR domain-containing protein [Ignavibacteria bacterium]